MALRQRQKTRQQLTSPTNWNVNNAEADQVYHSSEMVELLEQKDKTFPRFMRKRSNVWVLLLLSIMTMLIILEIVLSLYYQLALHENILSG